MARRLLAVLGFLACVCAPWSLSAAMAEEMDANDAQAIREVVQSQLDAFSEDDADKAFSLASASAQSLLGTADNFLQIVKRQYPPVYRHRVVIFSTPEVIEGRTLQLVRLTDRDSLVWIAVYVMEREQDGTWKIDGCRLLETTSVSI